jgi:hypothetical protein
MFSLTGKLVPYCSAYLGHDILPWVRTLPVLTPTGDILRARVCSMESGPPFSAVFEAQ